MPADRLRALVESWRQKLRHAFDTKKKEFGDDADEAMRFFNGPYDFLYSWRGSASSAGFSPGAEDDVPAPTFRMTVNKVAELVQIFGPALYHRNPVRKVNPRKPPILPIEVFGDPNDPNVQIGYAQVVQQLTQMKGKDTARSALMEAYLNYTPTALDLKTESRWAIDEAIIKGRGVLWTETYRPAGMPMTMAGSFFDSVDNLLIDPDAERINLACWMARRHCEPYWQVERKFGLEPDTLKSRATIESYNRQSEVSAAPDGDYLRKQGRTNDLVVYWELFSKMGMGGKLAGLADGFRQSLDALGDYCYLAVCEQCPWPINIPREICDALMDDDPMMAAAGQQAAMPYVQWPTPFWADDAWPCSFMDFHPVPRKVWPMSHIKPGMGELKFLNWAYSFLAGKVRTASRDFIAIAKSAGEEVKSRIQTGPDYTMIEVDALHGEIDKMVKFLQHPGFNPEIYTIIKGVEANFERRTGLTELMFGMTSRQDRSATESSARENAANVRPDDMANKVEDAMSDVARKEALCARWHVKPEDVKPILGDLGAQWWGAMVTATDPGELLHQFEYRIEAGSTKKPNKQLDASNMQSAMQSLFTPLWSFATGTGNVGPVNNLIAAWAKTMDFDPTPFMLPQAPPPEPQPAPAPGNGRLPPAAQARQQLGNGRS